MSMEISERSNDERCGNNDDEAAAINNNDEASEEWTGLNRSSSSLQPPPQQQSSSSATISWFDASMHIIKGNLGPGCLNIPHVFVLSGYILGLWLFFIVVFQGIYSMYILVECKVQLQRHYYHHGTVITPPPPPAPPTTQASAATTTAYPQQQQQQQPLSSSSTQSSPTLTPIHTFMDVSYVTFGIFGSTITQILIAVLQLGVCCVFLSLLATNLHAQIVSSNMSTSHITSDECVVIVTLALLGIVLFRNLSDIKWLSSIANIFMIIAILTATMSAILEGISNSNNNNDNERPIPIKSTSDIANIATFVSAMFFSFEGIGLVLPIQNAYVGSQDIQRQDIIEQEHESLYRQSSNQPPRYSNNLQQQETNRRYMIFQKHILIGSMMIVAILFLLIGLTTSIVYTDISSGSITAYLTQQYPNNRWYPVCNILVMVAVFFTFPLQLTPAMEVINIWFKPGCDPQCCGIGNVNSPNWCHGLLLIRRRRRRPSSSRRRRSSRRRPNNSHTILDDEVNNNVVDESEYKDDDDSSRQYNRDGLLQLTPIRVPSIESPNLNMPKADALLPFKDDTDKMLISEIQTNGTVRREDDRTHQYTVTNGIITNNHHDNTSTNIALITDDNDEEEIYVSNNSPPPISVHDSCFGKYEWIFRRYMVVFGCAIVVLIVDDLAVLMSLFGAIGQTGLALLPCAIHLKLQQRNIITPTNKLLCLIDGCTIFFSFSVMITGVIFSIQEIVRQKQN